jgi:hypothetical protein
MTNSSLLFRTFLIVLVAIGDYEWVASSFVIDSPLASFASRMRGRQSPNTLLLRRPLSAKSVNDENKNKTNAPISFFEGAVQSLTGDGQYQFGDLSKKALSELTGKDFASRNSTEQYEFGDISKKVVSQAGKAVTGDEKYQFGDLTKGFLSDWDSSLEDWKGQALNELPVSVLQQTFGKLKKDERQALIVATVRLMAIALLSWGLWANLCTSFTVSAAWTKASWIESTKGVWNPFRMGSMHQQVFLRTYAVLRIWLDPLFLMIQAAGTLLIGLPYQQFLRSIEDRCVPKWVQEKHPLLGRVAALGLAFVWNFGVGVFTSGTGIGLGTLAGQRKLRGFSI